MESLNMLVIESDLNECEAAYMEDMSASPFWERLYSIDRVMDVLSLLRLDL